MALIMHNGPINKLPNYNMSIHWTMIRRLASLVFHETIVAVHCSSDSWPICLHNLQYSFIITSKDEALKHLLRNDGDRKPFTLYLFSHFLHSLQLPLDPSVALNRSISYTVCM